MEKPKSSKNSSEREKWNKIFNSLVQQLQSQQIQLEFLAKERKICEDHMKLLYDRWVYDVNTFQQQISQMKKDFTVEEKEHIVEIGKAEFVVGLKQRDAFKFNRKFEDADGELADFKEWFDDYLSRKCSESNDVPSSVANEKAETRHKAQEDELRRLRTENQRLASEKDSEISALLAQKKFVWNQYNKLEKDTTEKMRIKCTEIENAKEKIQACLRNIDELQLSNADKDNTIARLRTELAKLESDKSEEISRLSKELEFLKKSGSSSVTPVLRRSTAGSGPSKPRSTSRRTDRENIKEEPLSQPLEKGQRSTKRKAGERNPVAPKLFTSSFKVPKLRTSSPSVT